MLLESKIFNCRHTNRLWRVALYAAIVIFVIQLASLGFHRHDLTEESSDCVSCYLAAHVPSGTPAVSVDVAPTLTIMFYQLVPAALYFFVAQQSYLIPHSQAPPRHTSK
ncbi:MAG TPA: hypothetical protein VNW52_06360 [Burkholderiaceae bacterium]|nr:hypothetical protein [Burkholderiaceae bacterium]